MRYKPFVIIFLLVFSGSAMGNSEIIKLNLEKSIELALKNNHELKKALLDKDKAEEQVSEAYGSALFPKIDGTASYSRAIELPVFKFRIGDEEQSFKIGSDNTLTASVNVEQTIFSGSVFLAVGIAKIYAEISDKSFENSRLNMITQVKKAYYSVLVANEVVELARLNLKSAQDNLKNAESMFGAGLISEYDQIRARVQVQNLIPGLRQAENSVILAKNLLKIVTGLDVEQQIEISDSLKFAEISAPDLENSVDILMQNNSLINQLRLQIQFQDKLVSYQFSQHYPELTAFGNWQTQAQENDPQNLSSYAFKNSVSAGLTLRIPIFSGGQTSSKVQQANIDLMKTNQDYLQTTKSLKNRLESILLKIKEARELVDSYQATIDQAQRGYDISVKRFSAGLGTQLEVVDAQVAFTQAKVNYLSAIYDYYSYHAELDEMLGEKSFNN